jgi:hypothetical protein
VNAVHSCYRLLHERTALPALASWPSSNPTSDLIYLSASVVGLCVSVRGYSRRHSRRRKPSPDSEWS